MPESHSYQSFETERYNSELSKAFQPPANGYPAKGFWGHLWMVVKETAIGAAAGLGASMAAIYGFGKFKNQREGRDAQTTLAVPPWHEGKVYWSVIAGSAVGFVRGLLAAGSEKHSSQLRKQVYSQAEAFNQYASAAEHRIMELEQASTQHNNQASSHSHVAAEHERRTQEQDTAASVVK